MKTTTSPEVQTIENLGHIVTVKTTPRGLVACCMKQGPTIKNPSFNYLFTTEDALLNYLIKFFTNVQHRIDEKVKQAAIKKDARENFVNPYKVGQLLYASWGYDQTNIDFYQITSVKGKTVEIREIGGCLVDCSDYGPDAGKVKPIADDFKSEPMKKIVQIRCSYNGEIAHSIKGKYGYNLYEYTKGEEGIYYSSNR